jgi:hypothetical protein
MALGLILGIIGFVCGGAKAVNADQSGIHISDNTLHTKKDLNLASFESIDLDTSAFNVEFVPSDHHGIEMIYYNENCRPTYSVENGTLKVSDEARSRTFFNIDFGFLSPHNTIKIYLPTNAALKDVTIKNESGNVKIGNFSAQTTKIEASFGSIDAFDVTSNDVTETVKSGDIRMKNVKTNSLTANNEFGNIIAEDISATQLSSVMQSGDFTVRNSKTGNTTITSEFGKITAEDVTTTQLNAKCKSGDMRLSGTFSGKTELKSEFGNINLSTSLPENQYSYGLSIEFGDIRINGSKDEAHMKQNDNAANNITATNKSGDIDVNFEK